MSLCLDHISPATPFHKRCEPTDTYYYQGNDFSGPTTWDLLGH